MPERVPASQQTKLAFRRDVERFVRSPEARLTLPARVRKAMLHSAREDGPEAPKQLVRFLIEPNAAADKALNDAAQQAAALKGNKDLRVLINYVTKVAQSRSQSAVDGALLTRDVGLHSASRVHNTQRAGGAQSVRLFPKRGPKPTSETLRTAVLVEIASGAGRVSGLQRLGAVAHLHEIVRRLAAEGAVDVVGTTVSLTEKAESRLAEAGLVNCTPKALHAERMPPRWRPQSTSPTGAAADLHGLLGTRGWLTPYDMFDALPQHRPRAIQLALDDLLERGGIERFVLSRPGKECVAYGREDGDASLRRPASGPQARAWQRVATHLSHATWLELGEIAQLPCYAGEEVRRVRDHMLCHEAADFVERVSFSYTVATRHVHHEWFRIAANRAT